jgi:hypothetical protein
MVVKMDATKAIDAYKRAFKHLHQLPGYEPRAVLRAEAGSILKRWAGLVKVATPQQADWRARYRAGKRAFGAVSHIDRNPYRISVNTGLRGGEVGWVWYKHPGGGFIPAGIISDNGTITPNHIRFKPEVWSSVVAGMEAYADSLAGLLPFAQKSIGMGRQSVVQIADELGIDLSTVQGMGASASAIAKARAAIASTGKSYKNGFGTQGGSGWIKSWVRLETRMPKGAAMGMDRALVTAVSGRAKFITRAYKKGAFDSIDRAARAFPNVFRQIKLSRE